MAKIKLTESELQKVVTESVKEILKEMDLRTYDNIKDKAQMKKQTHKNSKPQNK
jgi:tartrate dehydratase alpha subunit/fumarate hydratase class I-like protein